MTVISIGSHSGGVGRTEAVAHISLSFAKNGYKVLAIDFTSQPNLQTRIGMTHVDLCKNNIDEVVCQKLKIEDVVYKTDYGLDFIGCTWNLSRLLEKFNQSQVVTALRDVVNPIKENYDYIFIDIPARPSNLDFCGLSASDTLLIPLRFGHLTSLIGMKSILESVYLLKNDYGIGIKNIGAFILNYSRNRFDSSLLEKSVKWTCDNNIQIIYPKIKAYYQDERDKLKTEYLQLGKNIDAFLKSERKEALITEF